ncbi:unnamed protein product [Gordionus sp. m RMFG-2023]
MFNYETRTNWDLLKPTFIINGDIKTKTSISPNRIIDLGDKVWFKVFGENKWDKGTFKRKQSDLLYVVDTGNRIIRRHLDQIKNRSHDMTNIDDYDEEDSSAKIFFKKGKDDVNISTPRPVRTLKKPERFRDFIMSMDETCKRSQYTKH